MNTFYRLFLTLTLFLPSFLGAQSVSLSRLLTEMGDRDQLARFPSPLYESLQASSYNRESTTKDAPGWFADSDGTGFIRTEVINGKQEWVAMEHTGPGAITKMWAPYFYYGGLDDLEGPIINIYLDGATTPTISENYFRLITGKGSVPPPFARVTARAGNSYLPIPFAKSCKVTFSQKPFYNIINYRAYPSGTVVETFTMSQLRKSLSQMNKISQILHSVYSADQGNAIHKNGMLEAGKEMQLSISGQKAIHQLEIFVEPEYLKKHPEVLRSVVLVGQFDQQQTIWVPLGDFFGSPNELNPFQTWTRTVNSLGQMVCTWIMPFKNAATISLQNLSSEPLPIQHFEIKYKNWVWNERSMYFHANWRPDDIVQGSTFIDWNFIDISGKGVLVGDAMTALNPDYGWWGEGDEKIYVDQAWEKKTPTHFGTGTEDYYGWAGGENPSKDDVFSHPYLANIEVGSDTKRRRDVRGFNICTRIRALDAIPFSKRLVFDMEASPGVQIRNPWDFLGYSAVVFWYGQQGAIHNRPAQPLKTAQPIMTLKELDEKSLKEKQKK